MTTEIEKQFFDTFGIEAKEKVNQTFNGAEFKVETIKEYPQITDRILLELIRIIGLITIKYTNEQCEICYGDGAISYLGKDLKETILNFLISKVSIFKHQVQALFKKAEE